MQLPGPRTRSPIDQTTIAAAEPPPGGLLRGGIVSRHGFFSAAGNRGTSYVSQGNVPSAQETSGSSPTTCSLGLGKRVPRRARNVREEAFGHQGLALISGSRWSPSETPRSVSRVPA
jgi:hypothetical protein